MLIRFLFLALSIVTPSEDRAVPAAVWESVGEMHAWYVARFVAQRGFGPARVRPVETSWPVTVDGERLQVTRHRLIGPPRLYEPMFPMRRRGKGGVLDARDTRALKALNGAFYLSRDRRRGYGPINATAACRRCHEVEVGTRLGVVRYDLAPAR